MNGVMTPGVSAGSNQVGASVTWIAHVISPAGAAQATVATASRTMSRTAASRPARVMGLRDGLQRSGHESAPHDHVRLLDTAPATGRAAEVPVIMLETLPMSIARPINSERGGCADGQGDVEGEEDVGDEAVVTGQGDQF